VDEHPSAPPGATPGVPGWFPDPWSKTRGRWWTGEAWTFSTIELNADQPLPPPPEAPEPMPATAVEPTPAPKSRTGPILVLLLALGLVFGVLGAKLLRDGSSSERAGDLPVLTTPTTGLIRPPAPPTTVDPREKALLSLVVVPADVSASSTVGLLPGGDGLTQPTLDLCNGTYPSEELREARLQDVVVDAQGLVTLSTEAVLYKDVAGATQALAEAKSVAAACPAEAVPGVAGEPAVTTRFNPTPDGDWPQTDTVTRLAFDLTTTDATGQTNHSIAVYLQRGRVLLGVYFPAPDGAQAPVAGQTTIPGIVGEFAGRVAALPASIVGS
jgi:hypothetical protein